MYSLSSNVAYLLVTLNHGLYLFLSNLANTLSIASTISASVLFLIDLNRIREQQWPINYVLITRAWHYIIWHIRCLLRFTIEEEECKWGSTRVSSSLMLSVEWSNMCGIWYWGIFYNRSRTPYFFLITVGDRGLDACVDSFTDFSRDNFVLPVTVRVLKTWITMCLIWERLVGFLTCNICEAEILARDQLASPK